MTPRRALLLAPTALFTAGLLAAALLAGCAYSFSGTSIPERLRTVAVPLAETRAAGGPAALDQRLTDALVARFADRSRLSLVADEDAADAVVRATLTQYGVAPAAVTGDNLAALNRVSVAVRVVVQDRVENRDLLDRTFTATAAFAPAEGLAGEAEAAERAVAQIARDAFTAATSEG